MPARLEVDPRSILERFAQAQPRPKVRVALRRAIHARGAFRHFRDAADEHGPLDRRYAFESAACEDIVRRWLRAHGLRRGARSSVASRGRPGGARG